jgi:hypothetical protein
MKMVAKKHFMFSGNLIRQGETFTTTEAKSHEYERNNLAEKVEDKSVAPDYTQEFGAEITGDIEPLANKTVSELRKIAREKGITGTRTMTRSDLLTNLES